MLIRSRIACTVLTIGVAVGVVGSAPSFAQDKVVRIWHTETEPQTIKAFNDIARRFEAKSPGVKIEAEGLAWGDLEGKIMAALAAGSRSRSRLRSLRGKDRRSTPSWCRRSNAMNMSRDCAARGVDHAGLALEHRGARWH